jgi:hypothetical protein
MQRNIFLGRFVPAICLCCVLSPAKFACAQGGPSVWKIHVVPPGMVTVHQDDNYIDIPYEGQLPAVPLRARVFRGQMYTLIHGGNRLPGRDGCWMFSTCFLSPLPGEIPNIVRLPARLNDDRWLCANKNKLEDGYFVIVFEVAGPNTIFKIDPDSVKEYFSHGVEVRVVAQGKEMPERVAVVEAATANQQAALAAQRKRYEDEKNCVVLRDTGDGDTAALLPCGPASLIPRSVSDLEWGPNERQVEPEGIGVR